jgi:hypothetical protein
MESKSPVMRAKTNEPLHKLKSVHPDGRMIDVLVLW